MQEAVQQVFDRLVQLMAPFGWEVSMDAGCGEFRTAKFRLTLRVRNPASKINGQVLGFEQAYQEYDLTQPGFTATLPERIATEVLVSAVSLVSRSLPRA